MLKKFLASNLVIPARKAMSKQFLFKAPVIPRSESTRNVLIPVIPSSESESESLIAVVF